MKAKYDAHILCSTGFEFVEHLRFDELVPRAIEERNTARAILRNDAFSWP